MPIYPAPRTARDARRHLAGAVTQVNDMLNTWPRSGPQPRLAVSFGNRVGAAMVYGPGPSVGRQAGSAGAAARMPTRLALEAMVDYVNGLLNAWPDTDGEPPLDLSDGRLVIR
jgi:hypothetical protein